MPTVASVTPANGASAVSINSVVSVELTRADSHNSIKKETTQADFGAGTLSHVVALASGDLVLGAPLTDRIDLFTDPSDVVGSIPDGWANQFGSGYTIQQTDSRNWAKHVGTGSALNGLRWNLWGTSADQDVVVTWRCDTTTSRAGLGVRMAGAGGSETCYLIRSEGDGATFKVYKVVSGALTQLGSTINLSYTTATDYKLRLQVIGTAVRAKAWLASGAEPGSWNVDTTDSAISAAGYVGPVSYSPTATWYTNVRILGGGSPQLGNFDFASDAIGSVPSGWTRYDGTAISVQSFGGGNVLKRNAGNNVWDDAGPTSAVGYRDIDVYFDEYFDGTHYGGIKVRDYNPGSGECFYSFDTYNNAYAEFVRCVNGASTTFSSTSVAFSANTWYRFRVQIVGASPTVLRAKWWERSGSEPTTWNVSTTDSTGPQTVSAGATAKLWAFFNCNVYWDNVILNTGQFGVGTYALSGSRVSPAQALSDVGVFGAAVVEFDSTLPTGTTLTMSISKDNANWTPVANGDHVALWSEGDSLASASIYTKAELATADSSVTPVLSEIRVRFLPVDSALVEIDVDGVVCTIANGKLLVCGKTAKDVSGTITDPCYEDTTIQTVGKWQNYTPKTVTVLVKYNGATISTTTFTTLAYNDYATARNSSPILGALGGAFGTFMALARGGVYDGPMQMEGVAMIWDVEYWLARGEFVYLIAEPPRSSMDAMYYIAHLAQWYTSASLVVGEPVEEIVYGSVVVKGYASVYDPASVVVQGYTGYINPASIIAAIAFAEHLGVASIIAGSQITHLENGSMLVYETSRGTMIEIRMIGDAMQRILDSLGITTEDIS